MIEITFKQIEIFIQVARLQNLRKASKKLLMSHSAVSMSISSLEHYVKGPLFDRKKRRLVLNKRGEFLLKKMSPIWAETKDHIQFLQKDTIYSDLQIGGSTTIGNYLLPKLIGNFYKEVNRYINIQLTVENTASIEKKVENNELDLALIEGPVSNKKNLVVTPWIKDELIIISNQKNFIFTQQSLKKLANKPWILREPGSGTLDFFSKELKKQDISLKKIITMGHTEAIKNAVKSGLGISCLSKLSVQQELKHGILYQIPIQEKLYRNLSIVTPKNNHYQSKSQLLFLDFLKNVSFNYF